MFIQISYSHRDRPVHGYLQENHIRIASAQTVSKNSNRFMLQ